MWRSGGNPQCPGRLDFHLGLDEEIDVRTKQLQLELNTHHSHSHDIVGCQFLVLEYPLPCLFSIKIRGELEIEILVIFQGDGCTPNETERDFLVDGVVQTDVLDDIGLSRHGDADGSPDIVVGAVVGKPTQELGGLDEEFDWIHIANSQCVRI